MRAALRPAGPAPTMMTSYFALAEALEPTPLISSTDQRHEPRLTAQRFQINIHTRARSRERRQLLRHTVEGLQGAFLVAAERVEARDVVAGERVVCAVRHTRVEALQRPAEMPLRV